MMFRRRERSGGVAAAPPDGVAREQPAAGPEGRAAPAATTARSGEAAPAQSVPARGAAAAPAAAEGRRGRYRRRGRAAAAGAAAVDALSLALLRLARLVMLIAALIALLIALAIVLRVADANPSNSVVKGIHEGANFFAGSFTGLIKYTGHPKRAIAVNWGIALIVYLVVGAIVAWLIAALAPARRGRLAGGRRTALSP